MIEPCHAKAPAASFVGHVHNRAMAADRFIMADIRYRAVTMPIVTMPATTIPTAAP